VLFLPLGEEMFFPGVGNIFPTAGKKFSHGREFSCLFYRKNSINIFFNRNEEEPD
jgi:hypothetical protein